MIHSSRTVRWLVTRLLVPKNLVPAIPLLFLGVFVVWPLVAVLVRSFGSASSGRARSVLSRGSTWEIVGFTLGQALASVALTLVVGLPLAHVIATHQFRGRSFVRALVIMPFVLPTIVVAATFRSLTSGWVIGSTSIAETALPIVFAHAFFNIAVVVRVVGAYWGSVDLRRVEAAQVLGAGRWRVLRTVTWPTLRPALVGAGALVFLFSFTSFAVIQVLGGPRRATVETEIYRYAVFRTEFDVAASLAVMQMVVVAALAWFSARFQRALPRASRSSMSPKATATRGGKFYVWSVVIVSVLWVMVPLGALIRRSLSVGDGYGVSNYGRLFERVQLLPVSGARALLNSLVFALVAALLAAAVGVLASWAARDGGLTGRAIELLGFVPLGVSAVTLGFGYIVGFEISELRRSPLMVPLAHAVIGLPFVIGAVTPSRRSIPRSVPEAAAVLGASPLRRAWSIEWPLVRVSALTGAGFAFAVSFGEFGASSFVARGAESFTAPLAIGRLLSQPGDLLQGQAAALSVVLGLVVGLVALVLDSVRSRAGQAGGLL